MKKRDFLKSSAAIASLAIIPSPLWSMKKSKVRIAQIGVGGMGVQDLNFMSSHNSADVVALCDVDSIALNNAKKIHPKAKLYKDFVDLTYIWILMNWFLVLHESIVPEPVQCP